MIVKKKKIKQNLFIHIFICFKKLQFVIIFTFVKKKKEEFNHPFSTQNTIYPPHHHHLPISILKGDGNLLSFLESHH